MGVFDWAYCQFHLTTFPMRCNYCLGPSPLSSNYQSTHHPGTHGPIMLQMSRLVPLRIEKKVLNGDFRRFHLTFCNLSKLCRSRPDDAFCGIWSGSALFANVPVQVLPSLHGTLTSSDRNSVAINSNIIKRFKFFAYFWSNFSFYYSWLSLSRPRLSRITAYLEVKIWSLPIHENLTIDGKYCRKEEKLLLRSNFSSLTQYFQYISNFKSPITYQFVKCG